MDFLHSVPWQILWMQPCPIRIKRLIVKNAIHRGLPGGYAVCSSLRESKISSWFVSDHQLGSPHISFSSISLYREDEWETKAWSLGNFALCIEKKNTQLFRWRKIPKQAPGALTWKCFPRNEGHKEKDSELRAFYCRKDVFMRMKESYFYTWSKWVCALLPEELLEVFPSDENGTKSIRTGEAKEPKKVGSSKPDQMR